MNSRVEQSLSWVSNHQLQRNERKADVMATSRKIHTTLVFQRIEVKSNKSKPF